MKWCRRFTVVYPSNVFDNNNFLKKAFAKSADF